MEKQQLKEEHFADYYAQQEKQKRLMKILMISGIVLGTLYFSRYFLNAAAETIRACKNLRDAVKS